MSNLKQGIFPRFSRVEFELNYHVNYLKKMVNFSEITFKHCTYKLKFQVLDLLLFGCHKQHFAALIHPKFCGSLVIKSHTHSFSLTHLLDFDM